MRKPAHTPEIWKPHVGLDYACVMLPGENTDTASISVHTDCPDERDRLLNMIAAAPELLESLREIVDALADGYSPNRQKIERARAAITKAEGR